MRFFGRWLLFVSIVLASIARGEQVDVVIYGATRGGIAAALAAAKGGHSEFAIFFPSR